MLESTYTVKDYTELSNIVEKFISKKRFRHCKAVAHTCAYVLDLYKCTDYVYSFKSFSGALFCGLIHDIAREMTDQELLNYCSYHKIQISESFKESPVLLHGIVSASMAYSFLPSYPESWANAISYHTTGNDNLDDLGIALFISDFTEPNRSFLSPTDREQIYSNENIYLCALEVLNRMISHAQLTKKYEISSYSLKFKLYLEQKSKI